MVLLQWSIVGGRTRLDTGTVNEIRLWIYQRGRKMQSINHATNMLPMFKRHIAEVINDSQEQYKNLMEAKDKPRGLYDKIIDEREEYKWRAQGDDIELFRSQVQRWLTQSLSQEEQYAVEQFQKQLDELSGITKKLIVLVKKMKVPTVDKIALMSDVELACDISRRISSKRIFSEGSK
jgi:hypothetical protein